MNSEISRIECSEVKFGDFEFRYGHCNNCFTSRSVMQIDSGLYSICSGCLERGLKLLMKLVGSPKAVI